VKLGYIDYLNCYPFYHEMFERKKLEGIRIIPAYPSELNRMMKNRELDMSPISAAAYAGRDRQMLLLPDFCLSSAGYVGSVVLRSKIPIEDLHQKKVGVTRASETCVVLLKIILKRYYGIEPVYQVTEPNPKLQDLDAALIIGNEAMVPGPETVSHAYDLGELWLRKTGFPVVFAVFAVQEAAIEKYLTKIKAVIQSYHNSLQFLEAKREDVIAGAQKRYPHILYDLDAYYRTLQFVFTGGLTAALEFYLAAAGELELLPEGTELRFLKLERPQ